MLDDRPRIRRRVGLPLALFLLTCATTFVAGVYGWTPSMIDSSFGERFRLFWPRGLEYMVAVIGVLLAHEMGHFLMTVRYGIPASYPIFIPMPLLTMTGTMGAVISMDGLPPTAARYSTSDLQGRSPGWSWRFLCYALD